MWLEMLPTMGTPLRVKGRRSDLSLLNLPAEKVEVAGVWQPSPPFPSPPIFTYTSGLGEYPTPSW